MCHKNKLFSFADSIAQMDYNTALNVIHHILQIFFKLLLSCLPCHLCTHRSYQESSSKVTADGVVGLTRAFLAAGAQCTLVSLWPVPVAASKVFVHAFYTALLNGTKASAALADAMKTVQSSKQYSHPSNWAGQR